MDMVILKTRSKVKFKVTVAKLWSASLPYSKMHHHTKFETPSSNNIRDMLRSWLFWKLGQSQGLSDPKMVCDTRPFQDAFTHEIWNSYLKEYRRYAPDTMQF